MKRALLYVAAMIAAVPLAFVLTFLCSPFWNWFESATGIESYGHSGPSDWCFWLTYAVMLLCFFIGITVAGKRR